MTDGGAARPDEVRAAVAAGVDWVQLRDRTLPGRSLLESARALRAAAAAGAAGRPGGCVLLLNRRLDVALALSCDPRAGVRIGVHLGFDAPSLAEARRVLDALGPLRGPVGVATHGPEEVATAAAAGADYAQLAPIFDPISKPRERPALGTFALAEASRGAGPCRLLAQGGIDGGSAEAALRAGAHGVAVTGAVLGASDPGAAAAGLRATLDAAARGRARSGLRRGAPPAEDGS